MTLDIKFEETQFNRIFPFYILISPDLIVSSCGKTLEKLFPGTCNKPFTLNYRVKRPELEASDFRTMLSLINQLVIIECNNRHRIVLRGQFEFIECNQQLLFIGSPWFNSMEQVIDNQLKINDFSYHDPLIDLLHILKTQEISNNDLKHLLTTVNNQKEELKRAAKEIHEIALFPMQNPDPLIRIDQKGNILKQNPAAEKFSEFIFNGNKYSVEEFWRFFAGKLNLSAEREVYEVDSDGKTYSFVVRPIAHYDYFNIYGRDITLQKKSEEQIKLLALVASANENGVLFTSPQGQIFYANDGYYKLTLYHKNEVIGQNLREISHHVVSNKNTEKEIQRAYLSGNHFDIELIQHRKDGTWFWGRFKGQPVLDGNKNVIHYFIMIEDITREKEREEQLNVLSSIAADNTHGVVISDKNGRIEWVNNSFMNMTGYSFGELIGVKPGKFLQGKDTNPETIAYLKNQLAMGEPFVCEILNYNKSGKPYWVRIQGQALKNNNHETIKYFAIEEDITKEKETQQKLKDFESQFRFAIEKLGDNVWEYDFRTNQTIFSSPKNNFLGFVFDDLNDNNKIWWQHVHPDDLHILSENDISCRKGDSDYHVLEYRMVLDDKSIRWVLDRGVVIEKTNEGKPLRIIGTHTDITNQKNAEEAVRRKEEKYRNIIANINLGLLEVDNNEIIQYANQSFCLMSGYSEQELIGKKASTLLAREESIETIKERNELRKKGFSDAYEVSVSNKQGEHRWWLISGAPNYNDKGELIGSIGIHLDITEKKKLELEIIEAKNNAEASTRAKEIFLANMSHEIRTPMNAIIGMSNQLSKSTLTTDQQFYLQTIRKASENLLIIINDVLDLSKIEAGKLALENIGFEPSKIIEEIMQVMMYKAQEKGILLTNSFFDARLYPVLIGDPYRITQVLINLVSNAIKFTEKGNVDIICEVVNDETNAQTIKTTVKDTGIGMEDSFVAQLFDKFSQESVSGSRKYGGTGLGMSISKDLIELMGGQIQVESKKGEGSTISFVLKLQKGQISDLLSNEKIEITANFLAGKKIIVADDNDHNRLVASIILQNYGASIIEARDGSEAVSAKINNDADLILMDIQMPVMNGYEATRVLRQSEANLPIIALTANAIKGENEKCLAAGMNDYISKPFREEDFLRIIAKWLIGSEIEETAQEIESFRQPEQTEILYDLTIMKSFSKGNDDFIRKVVHLFCSQTPMVMDEMIQAYESGDLQLVGTLAHKLKASLDNFNIHSLKDIIRTIEITGIENQTTPDLSNMIQFTRKTILQVVEQMRIDFPTETQQNSP